MFQANKHKKTTSSSFNQEIFTKSKKSLRKRQKTPDFKSNTPKKCNQTKKSQINQNNKQKIEDFCIQKEPLTQNKQNLPSKPSCTNCLQHSKTIEQLQTKLIQSIALIKECRTKFDQQKNQYERKLKKYKAKNRLFKDQLKLFKWILGQRKDFEQIIQQIEKRKTENNNKQFSSNIQQQNQDEQQKNNNAKNNKPQKEVEFQTKQDKIANQQIQTQPGTHRQHIYIQNGISNDQQFKSINHHIQIQKQMQFKQKLHEEKESLLIEKINILEQRLLELTIKNDFLEKLKVKPQKEQQYKVNNYLPNASPSFYNSDQKIGQSSAKLQSSHLNGYYQQPQISHFNNLNSYYQQYQRKLKLNQTGPIQQENLGINQDKISYKNAIDRKPHQIPTMNETKQNCWNLPRQYNQQVQSRYLSPIKKEYQYEKNVRQSSNKKFSYLNNQESINHFQSQSSKIPQSRSRYMDSIKQRSQLLEQSLY